MPSPFKDLRPPASEVTSEDWGGQYDCLEIVGNPARRCNGYATVAKYIPSERLLTWKCMFGHISVLEDIDDE